VNCQMGQRIPKNFRKSNRREHAKGGGWMLKDKATHMREDCGISSDGPVIKSVPFTKKKDVSVTGTLLENSANTGGGGSH